MEIGAWLKASSIGLLLTFDCSILPFRWQACYAHSLSSFRRRWYPVDLQNESGIKYIFARWMFLVIPFLFASHIVVVAGNVVQSRPVTRFERPRALRLVDISLCGHVVVVVAFCCFCCSSVDHFQLCPRWIFKPIGIVVRDVRGIC